MVWHGSSRTREESSPPLLDLLVGPLILRGSPTREEVEQDAADAHAALRAAVAERPGGAGVSRRRSPSSRPPVSARRTAGAAARAGLDWLALNGRGLSTLAGVGRLYEARHLAARAALAAERFRLARGRFPVTVAEAREAGFGGPADGRHAGPLAAHGPRRPPPRLRRRGRRRRRRRPARGPGRSDGRLPAAVLLAAAAAARRRRGPLRRLKCQGASAPCPRRESRPGRTRS